MHRFDRGAARRPIVFVLALAALAAVQPPAHAQEGEEPAPSQEAREARPGTEPAEAAGSDDAPATTVEDAVTVLEEGARELARVPGGTGFVATEEIDRTRARNLDDVLDFVPGVLASSRFGADEAKISIRGSGLRNNFHHRGTNILINGNPYQDADGFGDFESLDLLAVERIEVWKGANALRFGAGSLGGAINLVTKSGQTASPLAAEAQAGSYSAFRGQLSAGGVRGPFSYYLSGSDTEFDGYREHSDQGRQRLFGNLGWRLSERTSARADLIYANAGEELPGALTPEEFRAAPEQADPQNVLGGNGRYYDYGRLGVDLERRLDRRQGIGLSVFGDFRDMSHPIFQILDQDNRNAGGEVRYLFDGAGGLLHRFVAGIRSQVGGAGERRFENVLGEPGALVADFATESQSHALYAEAELAPAAGLSLLVGGRFESARREHDDRFLEDGDGSDTRSYDAVSPRVGFVWAVTDAVEVFGNASRAYEPPLMLELNGFGAPGFLPLEAQDAWQYEVGGRGRAFGSVAWNLALYDIEIEDELLNENVRPFPGAPFTIPTYRNAPETRHRGVELGLDGLAAESAFEEGDRVTWRAAYTYSDFRFVDDPAFGDNDLPGAPPQVLHAEVAYRHPGGWWLAPRVEWVAEDYFADSANTQEVEGYALLDLSVGHAWERWELLVSGTNLTDQLYAASVQVDNALGRYLEPGPGRAASVTLRWRR